MSTITIGVGLPKSVFSVHERMTRCSSRICAVGRWSVARPAARRHRGGDGSCSGAHDWVRRRLAYGLQQRLIAVQFATPFHKGRKIRDDRADAKRSPRRPARGSVRFVPVRIRVSSLRLFVPQDPAITAELLLAPTPDRRPNRVSATVRTMSADIHDGVLREHGRLISGGL